MAADLPPEPPAAVSTLEVVGARLPPWAGDPAFSIKRLSAEDLQSSQRLDEALSDVPQVNLFRRNSSLGANPTTQGLSMRGITGSGAGRSLVTLDGVPQNDPFGGWVIWSGIPSESLSGVDLVRGAGSGPYGAGALTGVVALDERSSRSPWLVVNASGGELGDRRAAAAGETSFGAFRIMGVASGETSSGYTPVRTSAGAADTPLTLDAQSAGLRVETDLGGGVLAARAGYYREARDSGLAGATSSSSGTTGSLTYALAPHGNNFGYRLQGWIRETDLANSSFSVAAGRTSTTITNNQYETPTTGYGFNGALRRAGQDWTLELGADYRTADGEDHEYFSPGLVNNRVAGGKTLVEGVYLEGTKTTGPWLLAAGLRTDHWETTDSKRVQRNRTTNAVVGTDQFAPDRDGNLPTGRAAVRFQLADGLYLRGAAYAGFRAPSLNELHRPFTVGSVVTEANPGLKPEELRGVEIGFSGQRGRANWSVTAFSNQLEDAITNVTLCSVTVGTCTRALDGYTAFNGTSGSAGVLRQRRNAQTVEATGIEADLTYAIPDTGFTLNAAAAYTDAKQGALRPAQAAQVAASGGLAYKIGQLTFETSAHYEGSRFEDDLNSQKLGSGTTVDARIDYQINSNARVYIAGDNITDARIRTGVSAAAGVNYYQEGPPRALRVGLTFRR